MQSFSPIIDTAIGLVMVYIAFSLLASWVNEQLSGFFKTRGKLLVAAITQLLSGSAGATNTATQKFFSDPIFTAMKKSVASNPQYVSAQQFSSIVVGMVNPPAAAPAAPADASKPADADVLAQIQKNAAALGIGPQVSSLVAKANGDYAAFVKAVEDWYDDHMDRVSGWYKQHSQLILIVIGALLAVIWNADSLRMVRALSCNAAIRASAQSLSANPGTAEKPNTAVVGSVLDAVPLGWQFTGGEVSERLLSCDAVGSGTTGQPGLVVFASMTTAERLEWLLMKVLGLIATAVALSLGAPFWFDALSKLTRVRMAGKKPEKTTNPSMAG